MPMLKNEEHVLFSLSFMNNIYFEFIVEETAQRLHKCIYLKIGQNYEYNK